MDALQVLGEPTRREILRLVWNRERRAGEIADAFDVTFGAVSQHLRVLREAGFVRVRPAGTERWYRADRAALGPLAQALEAMWGSALDRLAEAAEAEAAEQDPTAGSTPAAPDNAHPQPQVPPPAASARHAPRRRRTTRR